MSKYEYILFDVAGTLLHKPLFYGTFLNVLKNYDYVIDELEFKIRHKLLSEVILFPDRTDKEFYTFFNKEVLYSLGVLPNEEMLDKLFEVCSYLPWEKYKDTEVLTEIKIPIGIISNFNSTLKSKLDRFFSPIFNDILVSEELGVAKPSLDFYKRAIDQIGVAPNKILYIGDSLKLDIVPAKALGINTLLVDRDCFYPESKNRINSLKDMLTLINE